MRRRYRAKREVLAELPDGADERAIALRARGAGVGLHELHRHCTSRAPFPPALLLGFALPGESDLVTATQLLAGTVQRGALACAP